MKRACLILSIASLAAVLDAIDFKIVGPKPQPQNVVYTLTPNDIAIAIKVAIKSKYPNADLSSTNWYMTWSTNVYQNFIPSVPNTTNNFEFVIENIPTIPVPEEPQPHNFIIYSNWIQTNGIYR